MESAVNAKQEVHDFVIAGDTDERKYVQSYLVSKFQDNPKSLARNRGKDAWLLVLRAYAEGVPTKDICQLIQEKWDFTLTPASVSHMVKQESAQVYIKSFRDVYMSKVMEVPIANKRVRIDDYQKNLEIINKNIERLMEKDENTKDEKIELARLVALSTSLKSEVREEMEKRPQMFQNVNISMSGMTDEQLHRRKQELIGSVRRAEGRGAAGTAPDTDDIGAEAEIEST